MNVLAKSYKESFLLTNTCVCYYNKSFCTIVLCLDISDTRKIYIKSTQSVVFTSRGVLDSHSSTPLNTPLNSDSISETEAARTKQTVSLNNSIKQQLSASYCRLVEVGTFIVQYLQVTGATGLGENNR